jgi:predicted nucleic acid-binding protein
MENDKKVLFIDSSAFVGLMLRNDPHNEKAVFLFKQKINEGYQFVTSTAVVDETATVLSHRSGQQLALEFLNFVKGIKQYFLTEELRRETHLFFGKLSKKGTSMVDCSIIVMMKKMKIREIMTFDTWLEKQVTL